MAAKDDGASARRSVTVAQADPPGTKARKTPRKRTTDPNQSSGEQSPAETTSTASEPRRERRSSAPKRAPTTSNATDEHLSLGQEPPQADASAEDQPQAEPILIASEQSDPEQLPIAQPRERQRGGQANALGQLIEAHFGDPASPCRSYSDLERHSNISREALSRYVTARPDRRRSPTIDTLVAVADAMHLSLEAITRAAAASVKGVALPAEAEQQVREEVLGSLVAALSDEQFGAVIELLRQLRPAPVRG